MIANIKMTEEEFLKQREEVLATWRTGKDSQLEGRKIKQKNGTGIALFSGRSHNTIHRSCRCTQCDNRNRCDHP